LALAYNNNRGEACFVTVEAQVAWTSAPSIHDFVFVPNGRGLVRTEHVRNQWGVLITTHVTGTFWYFNPKSLVDALVQISVLFQLPVAICRFVALYCLGHVSEIYRRARTTKFDIYSAFHGGIARMLLAEIGFRGLLGGVWGDRLGSRASLTSESLFGHVQEVFQEQIDARVFKLQDIRQIAALTYRHMNHDHAAGVSCNEYIRSVMHDDTFDPSLLCKVLEDRQNEPLLQRFFSGNTKRLRRSMASTSSVGDETARPACDLHEETSECSWDPPAEECTLEAESLDSEDGLHKQQRAALAEVPIEASPQVMGKAVDAAATGATGPREVKEKKRETDYRQTAEFQQLMRDLEGTVAHFRQELEAQASSIRADLEHAASLKDETIALCSKAQGAADTSQQRIAHLEEKLLLLEGSFTGSRQEGIVSGAVTVQSQSGKVTPKSQTSMLSGLLMGATRSRSFRERASSTPTCSGTKSPAVTTPQTAEVSAVAMLEAAGVAARQHASQAPCGTDATPNAFLEACHAPAATRSVSLAGSVTHESLGEGKLRRPHKSRTPSQHREAKTESELQSAWQAARSQHFGDHAHLGTSHPGNAPTFTPTVSLAPFPTVSRPHSPPPREQDSLDVDRARETAEHLLRQQRLQQWQQRSQPRQDTMLGSSLVSCAARAPDASDKKRADEEAVMIF